MVGCWSTCARLVPSILLFWLATAEGQFIVYNGAQQLVFGSRGLQTALADPGVLGIYISGNVTLNSTNYNIPPPITNRTLLIAGDPSSQVQNVINFGGLLAALTVGEGGEVEFRNLTLSRPGPQNIRNSTANFVNLRSEPIGIWPSLIVLDGSRVNFNNSLLYYYSQIQWSRCANFARKIQFQLTDVLHVNNTVRLDPRNNASLLITDSFSLTADITNLTSNATVGEVELLTENTTMTCVDDPFPEDSAISGSPVPQTTSSRGGGSGFKWWYGLIIAVGAVVFFAAVAAIVAAVLLRRRRSAASDHEQGSKTTGSRSASEDQKPASNQASGSVEMTAAGPTGLARTLPNGSPAKSEPLPQTQPNLGALGSAGALSASGQSHASGMGREPEHTYSGNLGSSLGKGSGGAISESGFSWSDVTALLRARSDFSDVEVGPLIGRGSFGRVYKGRWKGAFVAIKIVDHQEAASKVIALREGTLSHSVQHPNVVTTYSVFLQRTQPSSTRQEDWDGEDSPRGEDEEGGSTVAPPAAEEPQHFATCLLLEYADRGTLEKAVMSGKFHDRASGETDLKAIHRTLLDIAGGMDYLHSVGVLHGDLKGANVLLKSTAADPRGFSCKLADFGMARILDTNRTHVSTQTYGTISYMPAELLKEGKLTRAVDSYSFAILLWELFAGEMLYSGMTMAQVFYKICYEQYVPPVPAAMPEEYSSLMIRCWDREPSKRPTFSEIFEYLQNMPKGGPRGSLSTSLASPTRNPDGADSSDSPIAAANGRGPEEPPKPRPFPGPNPFAAASTKPAKAADPDPGTPLAAAAPEK